MNTLRDRDIDRERDLSDYRQPREYDRGSDYARSPERGPNAPDDREISLGAGTILGIFFALALLCAVFFGFGYSMGRKSAQPALAGAAAPTGLFGGLKPSPGSPVGSPAKPAASAATAAPESEAGPESAPQPSPASSRVTAVQSSTAPGRAPVTASIPTPPASDDTRTPVVVRSAAKPAATPPTPASSTESAMPPIAPNGTAIVQVAAVSHPEDADLLVSELKKRGYAVFIRQEPQDHLLHVQVGPFATKKDADIMRQHLLADGYNAIVK